MLKSNKKLFLQFLNFSTRSSSNCTNQPSSSSSKNLSKRHAFLSFVDSIKVKYPDKLELLNKEVQELNNQRNSLKKCDNAFEFFDNLNKAVLNEHVAELVTVGSMVTKFINKESDYDFVFFPKNEISRQKFLKDFHQNPSFKQNFMSVFAKLLSRESEKLGEPIDKLVQLPRLRVPLLIIRYKSGLSMDIQFPEENYHAVRNTHLIRCYKMCDPRFTLLYLWLKTIADKLEIRNSKYGLLSSYHLLLLTIHFLQSEQALSPWPVLPVLSKLNSQLVTSEMSINKVVELIKNPPKPIKWESHNKMEVAELILRFVDYYYHFDPSKEAVYIEKGMALKRKQTFGNVRLQLIDPYSPVSVCRSPYAPASFFAAISFIRHKFKKGQMLSGFSNQTEENEFKRETQFSPWRTQMNDKIVL